MKANAARIGLLAVCFATTWLRAVALSSTFLERAAPDVAATPGPAAASAESSAHDRRHVVYTADATVFSALLRSMQSLALHVALPGSYTIHLIVPERDLEQASQLSRCFHKALGRGEHGAADVPRVLIHKELPMSFVADYRDRQDLKGHASAFARLFLAQTLPDVGRVLYMDSDTLVMGDLTDLFKLKLTSAVAAVQEGTSFYQLWGKWYPALAQVVPDQSRSIFNDGVMVVDLQRWRSDNITSEFAAWVTKAGAVVHDQLLLNLEFQQSRTFDPLPAEYNYFRVRPTGWPNFGWSGELPPDHPLCQAKILHWTGAKPWNLEQQKLQWIEEYHHLWEAPGTSAADK
mmetsp:Transcript_65428/g.175963  ORF Transcript_65428/g.175963 Transcript_65428/m.175963 type:complete len:346 (-) Transcript_65428:123-1160(-)